MRTSEWVSVLEAGRGPAFRLGAAVVASAAIAGAAASCSLIAQTSGDQCAAASECAGFPGLRSCDNGVCVEAAEPPACTDDEGCKTYADAACKAQLCVRTTCATDGDCAPPTVTCQTGKCESATTTTDCAVNADCVAAGKGELCRKDTKTCVSVKSVQCTTLYPDGPIADNAFIFGSILPTKGNDANTGLPIENSIKLAINDFTQAANGLPPAPGSTGNRPMVLLGCNDDSDADTAVAAAQHLVDEVGVSAIIGAAFSGITIKVATAVTIPKKVMLFSPSATSVAITNLDTSSPRLLWRTSPPDSFQAQALTFYMSDIEAKVRADNSLMATDKINVAVLFKGDAYGKGLAEELAKSLSFNGGTSTSSDTTHYFSENYGNPDDPSTDPPHYSDTVTHAIGKAPHVVFVFGTAEAVTDVFAKIEENWPAAISYKPRYVFADGGLVSNLWTYNKMTDALRQRVSGTVPGTTGALFSSFISSYKSKFGSDPDPSVFGTGGAYDIVHMLAFSAVFQGANPLTGSNLAKGMAALIPPATGTVPPINAGSSADITTAFGALAAAAASMKTGSVIDFAGTSGPLNFNLTKGEAPSDVQIWCMPVGNGSPAGAGKFSGYYYDSATDKMTGTLSWDCQ